jgi:hypothetical protein
MIDLAGRLHNIAPAENIVPSATRTEEPKTQSFATELSAELSGTSQSASQTSSSRASTLGERQSVTWRDPAGTSPATPSTTSPSGLSGLIISYSTGSSTSSAATAATTNSETPPEASMSFDQDYWASQPAAVQQLQNIQNPTQRTQVATQLAQEGYSIDVPIMVWGWDPQLTTQLRQADGYTWVPSAEQQPVEVAPGLTFEGTSYNPAKPPAGSIAV